MIPLRLELKNFLAYRSPDVLRFDGIHLACLTGPNGAGKSSLLDAITWALWGVLKSEATPTKRKPPPPAPRVVRRDDVDRDVVNLATIQF